MSDHRLAQCTAAGEDNVLYRHTKTTGTYLARPGQPLPEPDGGIWLPLAEDNLTGPPVEVIIGTEPAWRTIAGEVKEGDQINILFLPELFNEPYTSGLVQVKEVRPLIGTRIIRIGVERVGGFDPKKLVHRAVLTRC